MTLHKKLAHLTPEQVDDLVKRYNDDEKLTSLIEAFNIDAKPAGLVHLFPPVVHKDLPCPYCPDTNLISKRPARTYEPLQPEPPRCPMCRHRHADWCPCKPCRAKADAARCESDKKKRQVIEATYTREHDIPPPEDLTLQDAVFLMALARHAATDDLGYLKPYYDYDNTLAPLPDCRHDIIAHLYERGLIAICPDSNVEAFEFDEALTEIKRCRTSRARWVFLPGLEGEEKSEYLNRLRVLVSGGDWPDGWSRDVPALWHCIVKNECLEHFVHLLAQRGCKEHPIDQKTLALFDGLLVDFAPSRIFNLCWRGVTKTTDDIARKNTPYYYKRKDMFIRSIQRKADQAKTKGWDLKHFERNYHCPQTDVSATFFNDFLKLGNSAFEMVPPRWEGRCSGTVNIDQSGSHVADSPEPGYSAIYQAVKPTPPSASTPL